MKKATNKETVTLDDLARMVADGFENTSREIAEVRTDIVLVREEIRSVDSKVDALINATLVDLKHRVTSLEKKVGYAKAA